MAGYSKRTLAEKLGIKSGHKIYLGNAPAAHRQTLGKLPDEVTVARSIPKSCDLIQFFTQQRSELEHEFPVLKRNLSPSGSLWISWPKGSAKANTDLNENVVREIGLKHGLVDVKVCAVDDFWSGLKFVFRLTDRSG